MQQATVNLFADMGAQPATLISGLTAASASTDTTPPTSTITSPSANANLADGSAVTVTGTATDAGGGVVAGVEVSTDGGSTWHPATLTTPDGATVNWSYSWTAHGNPTTTIMSRATDDSGNRETPSAGVTVNVNCPCSIWGNPVTPQTIDSGDGSSVEVGVKFRSDVYGAVTGVRFYKASANTGTHVGSLWTASGTAARAGDVLGRDSIGVAAGHVLEPGLHQPEHDLHRRLLRAQGPLLGRHELLLLAGSDRRARNRQPAAARAPGDRVHAERHVFVQLYADRSRPTRISAPTTTSMSRSPPPPPPVRQPA